MRVTLSSSGCDSAWKSSKEGDRADRFQAQGYSCRVHSWFPWPGPRRGHNHGPVVMGRILGAQLHTYPLPLNRQEQREGLREWGPLPFSWRGWLQVFGMGVGQEMTVGNYTTTEGWNPQTGPNHSCLTGSRVLPRDACELCAETLHAHLRAWNQRLFLSGRYKKRADKVLVIEELKTYHSDSSNLQIGVFGWLSQ